MAPIIHFRHSACDTEIALQPANAGRFECPSCKTTAEMAVDAQTLNGGPVTTCVVCGHDAFYVQRDFNRQLGIAIVGTGIIVSLYFFARNEPIFAMLALVVTAFLDFLLYSLVDEVTVCYSCHAIYRGFERNSEHQAFDLKKLEKYGGRASRI